MAYSRLLLATSTACCALATASLAADKAEPFHIDLDEIIITSMGTERTIGETNVGSSVLTQKELQQRIESSIGETLRFEPGISSTAFGAGASRPIIRGLGGDRISVLDNGIGTIDASQTSVDHAVAVEPAFAERIEVIRGPATLLYGSSAAGGVVNILSDKIPSEAPENGYDAALRYSYGTNDDRNEIVGAGNFAVGKFVIHGEGFFRETDDYEIPGSNLSGQLRQVIDPELREERETNGFVDNSDLQTSGGTGGLTYLLDNGYIGVSGTVMHSNYGIPAGVLTEEDLEGGHGHGGGDDEEGEEGIRIDLETVRFDLAAELEGDYGLFEKVKIRAAYADYRHLELEGDEVGTKFENDSIEGRFEFTNKSYSFGGGDVTGAFGAQFEIREFSAVGAEAFVPPSDTESFGIFGLKEFRKGPWLFDIGGRFEYTENSTSGIETDFANFSVSGGIGYKIAENWYVGATVFRTERAPSIEELFSEGPHLATQTFEVGDPTLNEEVARGVEVTARGTLGPITTIVNGYYTDYSDFIYESETGEIEDGLPVFNFLAADAEFFGFEAQADYDFAEINGVDLSLHAQADYVRATVDVAGNQNLPRIPPLSALFGFSASSEYVDLRTEVEYVAEQEEVANFELPTDAFTQVNVFLSVKPFGSERDISLDIRGRNLNDADARTHSSFLKDTAPLPGRDIRFSIRAAI